MIQEQNNNFSNSNSIELPICLKHIEQNLGQYDLNFKKILKVQEKILAQERCTFFN